MTPQASAGSIIARNTAFGVGAQVALRVLSFLFSVLVVRRLGDSAFGDYSVVLAWAAVFSFIGDLGIAQYMTREMARNKEKGHQLFWDVSALRLILAIVTSVVTIIGAILSGYGSQMVLAIALYTVTYFWQAIFTPLQGVIAGYERLDVISVLTVIGQIIYMVAGALFLFAGFSYVWLTIPSLIQFPVLIYLSYRVIRKNQYTPPRFHISPKTWPALIRAGLPFAFIQVALTTAYQFDRLMLKGVVSTESIGWYSAAYTLTRSFLIFIGAFSTSLVLTLAREHEANPDAVRPWYYRSVRLILFTGLPLAVGGTLLADKLIHYFYGDEYMPAALPFAILMWDTLLLMYTSLGGNMTTSIKKEQLAMRIYITMALLNVITNIILIPHYGIIAASFTTLATEFTGVILFYRLFRREFGPGVGLRQAMRLVLATAVMGIVVFILRDAHILISIPAGVLTYALMVWLTRALMPDEQAVLMRGLRKLSRPVLGILGRLKPQPHGT
jgi:O-antigen/teichoic acid export membrane protein